MSKNKVYALIDCNNFFVSCEKVFRPELQDRSAVVLSNNDGCIVARSGDIKKLKEVPMGIPYFKVEHLLAEKRAAIFSANFGLYGDFSRRVVEALKTVTPHVEVYSIDESFIEVSSLLIDDYAVWARQLHEKILKWTGIPVGIGVGESKTLAKAAAEYGKQHDGSGQAISLIGQPKKTTDLGWTLSREEVLRWLPIQEVWGIGRRLGPQLRAYGVYTAYDLTQVPEAWAHQQLTVRGLKTLKELKGEACWEYMHGDDQQKQMAVTRMFGHNICSLSELEKAVANFAARAAARLRRHNQIAGGVHVYLRTGQHAPQAYYPSTYTTTRYPTADTSVIIQAALEGLQRIYREGFSYRKAGVTLLNLSSQDGQQLPLIEPQTEEQLLQRESLMQAMDRLNARYGKNALMTAAQGVGERQDWYSKRERRSPEYTTRWSDLPVVKTS